jgi:hypothetical protein
VSDDDPDWRRFEALTPPPANADPWSGLSPELRERIHRQHEAKRVWDNDPANKDVAEFWLEVPCRQRELETTKVLTQNTPAPDAISLAVRNEMLWYINAAIDVLPTHEDEVRTAPLEELQARIERVREHWKEADARYHLVASRLAAAPQKPQPKPPPRAARSPQDRIEEALRELRDVEGVDIQNHDRGLLQRMALKKSGIADGVRGSSKRTLERALKKVLESD